MYDKHIIVGGQSSTAFTIFVDAGTKSCASATKLTPTESAQHEEA